MKLSLTGRIARTSAARPWLTIAVWVLALTASIYAAGGLGGALTQDDHNLIATESDSARTSAEHLRAADSAARGHGDHRRQVDRRHLRRARL